jgi:predicted transcriptional regulator
MFARHELYRVLICREHGCAVYGLDKHLKQHHSMPAAERRELLALYEDFHRIPPAEVAQPAPYGLPIDALV